MKSLKVLILLMLSLPLFFSSQLMAQETAEETTGLPGDNFSLEGALELFKKAESPEEFEKLLNSEENSVNNLDLDEDGQIDYIRVADNANGDVHAFVLQVPVSAEESQDIAVIELEKTGLEEAILQILGDEDIYGEAVIVEPFDVEEKTEGKGGPSSELSLARVVVNVYFWPSVRFVYTPGYRLWVSPFRWGYYPNWWKPWRPYPLHVYRPRVAVYTPRYRVVTTHRVVRAHKVYTPHRTYSRTVRTRTVTVRGGNNTVVGKKTTTTIRGPRGNVKARRSTTTVKRRKGRN